MLLHAFSFATVAMTLSGGKSVLDNSLGDAHIGISVRHLNVLWHSAATLGNNFVKRNDSGSGGDRTTYLPIDEAIDRLVYYRTVYFVLNCLIPSCYCRSAAYSNLRVLVLASSCSLITVIRQPMIKAIMLKEEPLHLATWL